MSETRCYRLEQLSTGQHYEEVVEFTQELLDGFCTLSGDRALAHVDGEHARRMGFDGRILHGMLTCLPYSRILGMFLPGSTTVIHSLKVDMVAPAYVGDSLTYRVEVERLLAAVNSVSLRLSARTAEDKLVNRGTAVCVFRSDSDEVG